MKKIAKAVPRETRMNKTEGRYELHLRMLRDQGLIADFRFEALSLRLGDNTFYMPDFLVQLPDGELEMHEVKGHWRDDARVKIKAAAAIFPFRFLAIQETRGGYKVENFSDPRTYHFNWIENPLTGE